MEKLSRIKVIDGFRGISVLWVIISHQLISLRANAPSKTLEWLEIIFHGLLGVKFFFVISGFIITSVLVKEKQNTGSLSLINFYKRRFVRLLPALYLFLLVMLIVSQMGERALTLSCTLSGLSFTEGLFRNCSWDLAHLWSLTVEEIFYLGWPLAMLLFVRRSIWSLVLSVSLFSILVRVAAYKLPQYLNPIDFGIIGYFGHLAFGSLLGYFYCYYPQKFRNFFKHHPGYLRTLGLIMVYIPQVLGHLGKFGLFVVPFGGLVGACGMGLILSSVLVYQKGWWFTIASNRYLIYIGMISYSLYLWQQPLFSVGVLSNTSLSFLAKFPINLIVMFAIASLSFYLIEKPIQKWAELRGFIKRYGS